MDDATVQAVAYVLSTLTILSCVFMKVPQIMSVTERRSADGIYVQAMILELTGFTITALYNYLNGYGILTYLEYPVIIIQLYVLMYYVLMYKRMLHLPIVPVAVCFYFTIVAGFIFEMFPKTILAYLLPLCTPLSGSAKMTYMFGIYMAGNAETVSLTTWVISVFTNMARVFTVYADSGDIKLLFNFIISTILSIGVLALSLYYQIISPPTPPQGRPRRKPSYRRHSDSSHYD